MPATVESIMLFKGQNASSPPFMTGGLEPANHSYCRSYK